MRLHALTVRNLNALYGEHCINFDAEFGEAPLFLIHGPTGSGKSTLLDAISLALFGQTPRLTLGKGDETTRTHHIMSRGEGTCGVELEFSKVRIGGVRERYRASWSMARAHKRSDGNPQDAVRRLERLDDGAWVTLCDSHQKKRYEEPFSLALEGLKPDEFQRSMLLAQGSFAAFLHATPDDKASILERLTDTSRFRALGRTAARRAQDARSTLQTLRTQVGEVQVLGADARAELDEEVSALSAQSAAARALRNSAQAARTWRQQYDALRAQHVQATERHATALAKLSESEPRQAALNAHKTGKRARLAKADLAVAETALGKRAAAEQEKSERVIEAQRAVASTLRSLHTSYAALNACRSRGARVRDEAEQLLAAARDVVATSQASLDAFAAQHYPDVRAETPRERWHRALRDAAHADQRKAREIASAAQQLAVERSDLEAREKDIAAVAADLDGHEAELKSAAEAHERAAAAAKRATIAKDTALRARSVEDHRERLQEGEACPLCGATEHLGLEEQRALAKQADGFVADAEARSAELERIAAQVGTLERSQAGLAAKKQAAVAERDRLTSRLAQLLGRVPKEMADDPELAARALAHASERVEELEAAIEAEREAGGAGARAESRLQKTQELLAAVDASLSESPPELAEGAELGDVDEDRSSTVLQAELTSAWANYRGAAAALPAGQAALEASQEETKAARERVEEASATFRSALEELKTDEQGLVRLTLPEEDVQRWTAEIDAATEAVERATGAVKLAKDTLEQHVKTPPPAQEAAALIAAELAELDAALAAAAENQTALDTRSGTATERRDQDDRARQRLADVASQLEEAERDNAVWERMNKLIGSSDGRAFQRFAQALNLRDLVARANERLARLRPRYALEVARKDGVPTLEFVVRDRHHGGQERPLTSLSGGETFLVSLALSLALADMRSSRMPIETLLLDEGFGTLDGETLESVMSALERLALDGGTRVGLISHVAALKDRIPQQIRVEPLGGGRSTISIGESS